jgi:hypothetical protein
MIVCGFSLKNLHKGFVNAPVIVTFDGDLQSIKNVCEAQFVTNET